MRIKIVLGGWLLAITLAWLAVLPPELGVSPLVDAQGAATGWWQLRQQALYLSGLWSIGLMALAMVLALRLPWLERPLGGMDQVYRLHKWAGISAALTAVLHWGADESSDWIKGLWGRAGRPARDAVLPWLTDARGFAKDLGEMAFYLLLAMVAITLLTRLLAYKPWRFLHRAMPLVFLALTLHTVALMPLTFWTLPLGLLMGTLLALGSLAAVWSLAGWIGRARSHAGHIHAVRTLGDGGAAAPRASASGPRTCKPPPARWTSGSAVRRVWAMRCTRTPAAPARGACTASPLPCVDPPKGAFHETPDPVAGPVPGPGSSPCAGGR